MILRSAFLAGESPKTFFRDIAQSLHEKEIKKHFGSRTEFRRGDPVVEAPVCFMLFTNRSGSNYVAELLKATKAFSGFGESTNSDAVINNSVRFGAKSLAEYYHTLVQTYGTAAPVFGLKVNVQQTVFLLRAGIIPNAFPDARWIWIQRSDILSQAISLYFAQSTLQWTSEQEGNGADVAYDFEEIASRMRGISRNNANLGRLVGALGLDPATVIYEMVLKRPHWAVRTIVEHFGMEYTAPRLRSIPISKQADPRKEAFRARFIAEARAALGWTPAPPG
ncbi:Stf0 family sulfotransferase [Faunimonas sp. B44]|uniref:Stf0 family sulfotransferase n=1 Tax=Faunimonas sp. B44 TaxID=3461493 RepID=UPI0040447A61